MYMIPITINKKILNHCKHNQSLILLPDDAFQPCCSMDLFDKNYYDKIKCDKTAKSINYELNNLNNFCNYHSCANYTPVDYTTQYTQVSLNNWQKCIGKCVSCYNYDNDFSNEKILTYEELNEYLTNIGEIYNLIIEKNKQAVIDNNLKDDELIIPVLTITGSADLFYSENYHNILKTDLTKYGIQRIKIITNFQTFTNHNLDSIHPNTKNIIDTITFSLDGINKEMYEKIRKGSKWENVFRGYENMIAHFPNLKVCQVNTVLSKWNIKHFKEFPNFIKEKFPAVNSIVFNFVSRWTDNKIFDELIPSKEETDEVIKWIDDNKNNFNIEVEYVINRK